MLPLRCKWGVLLSSGYCTAAVGGYRRFGTAYRSRLLWPLKLGPICCPAMSVTLAMNAAQYPKERIPQEGTDVVKVSYRVYRLYRFQLLGKYHYRIDMIRLCVPASAMLTLRGRWRPIQCALLILIKYKQWDISFVMPPVGLPIPLNAVCINPLKTNEILLYLGTQYVPHSKHISSRL